MLRKQKKSPSYEILRTSEHCYLVIINSCIFFKIFHVTNLGRIVKFHKMESLYMKFSEFYLCFHSSFEIWHSFSRTPVINFLWCYYKWIITSLALEKCKKECNVLQIILVQGFCPLKIKITQFPGGFRLSMYSHVLVWCEHSLKWRVTYRIVSKTYRPKNDIFCLLITFSFLFWYLTLRMCS